MADKNVADQKNDVGSNVKELEERLRSIMKERSTIESEIEDAKKHEQLLHQRASKIYAEEGKLRKQIADLRNALEAAAG